MPKKWLLLAEAVQRYGGPIDQAKRKIVEGGQGEEFKSRTRNNGSIKAMRGCDWHESAFDWEKSTITYLVASTSLDKWYATSFVEVDCETFDAWRAPAQQQKRAGGRPAKWSWEIFWVEVAARIHESGLPRTDAALVDEMLEWFGDEQPARSEVARRIATLRRRINSI